MNLLIESGATKSSWIVYDQKEQLDKQVLSGINPTSNPSSIQEINAFLLKDNLKIDTIHYYGAGVSSAESKDRLQNALTSKFGKVTVFCENDLLAAARAVSDGIASIVSILGTGTNTAVFDGKKLLPRRRSLGYIFEDYGSGFHIGKILVQRYYGDQMGTEDTALFEKRYISGKSDLIGRIYNASRPNSEVASLSRFLEACSEELRKEILTEVFKAFFDNQIMVIEYSDQYKLNFVGSISAVFEKELRQEAESCGYDVVSVCGNPIDRLLAYHQNHYH